LFLCPLSKWYTSKEQAWFENEGRNFLLDRWWKFTDDCISIPESLAPTFVKLFHEGIHSGWTALETTLAQHFYVPKLSSIRKTVCERCSLCARNNPRQRPRAPPQMQSVGGTPFENLTVDFTEMPRTRGCKYLLISGWVEAFCTWTEKVQEVARCLLKEIIPQFRIPVSIGSDNGSAFVAEVVQLMAKELGITWKLHMAYCPQSSGQIKYINRTLKLQLEKLCQETHLLWDQLLPRALLRIRSSPTKQMGLSPFSQEPMRGP
jgi:hypothetical protein